MPNLLNGNRFIIILRKFSRGTRLAFTLFFLSAIFLVWLFLFYLPYNSRLMNEKLAFKGNLKTHQHYRKALLSFNQIKNENEKLLKEFKELIVGGKRNQKSIDDLLIFLKDNDLKFVQFNPLETKNKDFYKKEYFDIRVKGKFVNYVSFFNDLEKIEGGIKIKNIEFTRKEPDYVLLSTKIRLVNF